MSSASSSPPSNPDNRIEAEMASKALKELKKTLRAHVDGLVQQLSQAEVRVQSEAITQHILSHPSFKQAQNVGIYASFPEHEASTVDLARQILRQGKRLYVPYITQSSPASSHPGAALPRGSKYEMCMQHVNADQYESMKPNAWGIPMPEHLDSSEDALNPERPADQSMDLMFLPASAYDQGMRRLGRGKGFYDRYLEKLDGFAEQTGRPKPLIVGMILRDQYLEEEHIPTAQHDRGVEKIVTPDGWIEEARR